jgi:hypothetical protein
MSRRILRCSSERWDHDARNGPATAGGRPSPIASGSLVLPACQAIEPAEILKSRSWKWTRWINVVSCNGDGLPSGRG